MAQTEEVAKLKASRTSQAGWLTRAIGQLDKFTYKPSKEVYAAVKDKISTQLQRFQNAHDAFTKHLTTDDDIEEAEAYYDEYFFKASNAISHIEKEMAKLMEIEVTRTEDLSMKQNIPTPEKGCNELIDEWIDKLLEGEETKTELAEQQNDLTHSLLNLQMNRDLPKIELPFFDGSALMWPKFVEQFYIQVHKRSGICDSRRMDILQSHTRGDAKRIIQGLGYSGRNYALCLKELKFAFGHRIKVANAYIDTITNGSQLVNGDVVALRNFYISVRDCIATLQQMNYTSELTSSHLLQRACRKIPIDKSVKWNEFVRDICKSREPTINDLKDWLRDCIDVELNPYAISVRPAKPNLTSQAPIRQTTMNTVRDNTTHTSADAQRLCCLCSGDHHISNCSRYTSMEVQERYYCAKEKRLCFNCLSQEHRIANCTSNTWCEYTGCGKRHHTLLHREVASNEHQVNNVQVKSAVYFQVLPVTVFGKNGRCLDTFALLDSASDVTFVNDQLAKDLGLKGIQKTLTINSVGSSVKLPSMCVSLSVKASKDIEAVPLWIQEAWTKQGMFSCPAFHSSSVNHLDHLKDLNLVNVAPEDIKILIGANVPKAHLQLDIREGKEGDPVAIHTKLGWCVLGGHTVEGVQATVNLIQTQEDQLNHQIHQFWDIESFGVTAKFKHPCSFEDQQAMHILDQETKFVDGHYEIPMLWRNKDKGLPDNKSMAEKRFQTLVKRLSRDEKLRDQYSHAMKQYIEKGYARKLTPEEILRNNERTWYLPHHNVINPKKPEKVRIVFDAAASFKGESLNKQLTTGPDLLNSLFGVIQRFRLKPIGIVADIADMFYQVHVPEKDSDSLRFLWKENITDNNLPEVYKMLVHIFGATDSPCCANYALKRISQDGSLDKLTATTIQRHFYVDDLLQSVDSVETAIKLAMNLNETLASKGFRLTKWMSSSKEVLSQIPEESRARPELNLSLSDLPVERALGITWDVEKDVFVFQTVQRTVALTKRGIVSAVSSVFDPCGFLAPFTFKAKVLIQEIWRHKIDWDEILPPELVAQWKQWSDELEDLQYVKIPRYFGTLPQSEDLEFHIFCDASEKGFAAVAYIRFKDIHGHINCVMCASKSHVAPTKPVLTIPKLELQGAVMAVRLLTTLLQEMYGNISTAVIWCDALTVLKYIYNDSKRWKIFVANRVAEIRENTEKHQWKYVPSSMNPADLATRGVSPRMLQEQSIWFNGPAFLLKEEIDWPTQPDIGQPSESDENLRKTSNNVNVTTNRKSKLSPSLVSLLDVIDPTHFSSWHKLKVRTAWLLRAVKNFLAVINESVEVIKGNKLIVSELVEAENLLVREAQMSGFKDYKDLCEGKALSEHSHLLPLSPFFDASLHLIRVGGRLQKSPYDHESKHQILLPNDNHISKLIVQEEHCKLAHCGQEHTIASLRQRYWPIKCRSLVKGVIKECLYCKRCRIQPNVPLMASLPSQRITGFSRPFTYSAVDYFGPMTVKRGRAHIKKWGCLFTCLVTRAIHLELADSLEADDFIMVLRCFVSRRGNPTEMFSDNGTNFVGAQRELHKLDTDQLNEFCLRRKITWHFIPPHAPHFGGAWERLVKSVKVMLKSVLQEQCVTETVLRTVLIEIEDAINSRPLTYNSSDPNDFTAITPNNFLRSSSNLCLPGQIHESEMCSRKRWRQSQVLADHLWKRWLKEYLPSLNIRSKWTKDVRDLQINDLVMLMDDTKPRGQWSLGRIVEICKGADDHVRAVKVKTTQGTYM